MARRPTNVLPPPTYADTVHNDNGMLSEEHTSQSLTYYYYGSGYYEQWSMHAQEVHQIRAYCMQMMYNNIMLWELLFDLRTRNDLNFTLAIVP